MEGDYRQMMELKVRAEAADVAKSQVHFILTKWMDGYKCVSTMSFLRISSLS